MTLKFCNLCEAFFYFHLLQLSKLKRDFQRHQKHLQVSVQSQWSQAVFDTHVTNGAAPFSGAKGAFCKVTTGIVLPSCSLQTSLRHCLRTKSQRFRAALCNLESVSLISVRFQKFHI